MKNITSPTNSNQDTATDNVALTDPELAPPSATDNTTQTEPLPSTSPSGPEPMPTYSQLLSTTWFLFKGIWWKSLLLQIGLYVLLVLLSALLFFLLFNSSYNGLVGTQDSEITSLEQSNSVYVALTAMILMIGYALAQVGMVQAYVVLLLSEISQNSVARSTLGKAWARSAKTIGTSIFVGALAMGAGVFFGIPGLIISIAGSFALFETIEKGVGAKTAFANSVQLLQGNKRQYFSLLFVTGLVTALIYVPVLFLVYVLQMLLQSLPSEYVPILLYVLMDWALRMVQFGTSILLNTFILAFSYSYYSQLKQRVILDEKGKAPTWMYVLGGIGLVILGIFMISIFGLTLLNAVAGSL